MGVLLAFYGGVRYGFRYARVADVCGTPRRDGVRRALDKLVGCEKTYSQFGQDLWVMHAVLPGKRDGFYVDVGSADGEVFSNSKLLDDLGWKGVCVDPFPRNMTRRTCQVFKQPVSSESGKRVQFLSAGDFGGIVPDPSVYKDKIRGSKGVELVTITLDEILDKSHAPAFIDYMSIDVEGAEYDALKGLSVERHRIGCFTVEHNFEPPKREQVHAWMTAHGYILAESRGVDDWYVDANLPTRYRAGR
jgi:FkbM family methyltransferase